MYNVYVQSSFTYLIMILLSKNWYSCTMCMYNHQSNMNQTSLQDHNWLQNTK